MKALLMFAVGLYAAGSCAAGPKPAALDVDFTDCVESIGVGLAPSAGVVALIVPPQIVGLPNDLTVTLRRPGDPRFTLHGMVVPSETPSGSFEALWWMGTSIGTIRMDTAVPVKQFNMFATAHMSVRVAP